MQSVTTCNSRNLPMELAKMVTAILFCLSHMDQSPAVSAVAQRMMSYGVIMFFAISGYFAFGASRKKLWRRLLHILKLYAIAYAVHIVCGCLMVELEGGSTVAWLITSIPDRDELIFWAATQHDSFLAHLWTMASTAICYGILWVYTRFFEEKPVNYQPLYIGCAILFLPYVIMKIILPAVGVYVPYLAYRNAWFLGLPSFVLGIFLHQYQERIFRCFRLTPGRLGLMAAAVYLLEIAGFSILLPVEVVLLMLFLIAAPNPPENSLLAKLAGKCGIWSTGVYILHITMLTVYYRLIQSSVATQFGEAEQWIQPVIVLILAFLGACIWDGIEAMRKRKQKHPVQ